MDTRLTVFKKIVQNVLDEEELDPSTIPENFRIQNVHGFGTFQCRFNPRHSSQHCLPPTVTTSRWGSYYTWVKLDLSDVERPIIYRWSQKCRYCFRARKAWWEQAEFEKMVKHAVMRCKKLIDGAWSTRPPEENRVKPPHLMKLCEKCGYGRWPCWAKVVG